MSGKGPGADRDPSGMLARVEGTGEQWREALARFDPKALPARRSWSSAVVAGMGGSAIAADLLAHYALRRGRVPWEVSRDYALPSAHGRGSLAILVSYSGNTEETLAAYREAGERGMDRLVLTTGGEIGRLAARDRVPVQPLPSGYAPRAALAASFVLLGRAAESLRLVDVEPGAWEETPRAVEGVLSADRAPLERVAGDLQGKLVLVYGARDPLGAVLVRARGQLSENAKVLAGHHALPELHHNEIEGWTGVAPHAQRLHVLLLRDESEHERVRLRADVTAGVVRDAHVPLTELRGQGKTLLARLFALIVQVDLVSVYLAYREGRDPTPVPGITALKDRLSAVPGGRA